MPYLLAFEGKYCQKIFSKGIPLLKQLHLSFRKQNNSIKDKRVDQQGLEHLLLDALHVVDGWRNLGRNFRSKLLLLLHVQMPAASHKGQRFSSGVFC